MAHNKTIQLYRATTAGSLPPAPLAAGELALDALDTIPHLYAGVDGGVVDLLAQANLGGPWLPLTGGTLSNPGNLTLNNATLNGGNPHIIAGLDFNRGNSQFTANAANTGSMWMESGTNWNTINFRVDLNRTVGSTGGGPIVLAIRNDSGNPSVAMPQGGYANGFFSAYTGFASHAPSGMYAPKGQYPLIILSPGADVPGVNLGAGIFDTRGYPGFDFIVDSDWIGTGPRFDNTGWSWSRFRCGSGGGWTLQAEYQRNDPSPGLGTIDRFWIGRGAIGSFGYNGRQAMRPAYPHIRMEPLEATGLLGGELTISATNLVFEGIPILTDRAQPATPRAGMLWYDTTANALKFYHAAAWNTVWPSSGGGGGASLPLTGGTLEGPLNFSDALGGMTMPEMDYLIQREFDALIIKSSHLSPWGERYVFTVQPNYSGGDFMAFNGDTYFGGENHSMDGVLYVEIGVATGILALSPSAVPAAASNGQVYFNQANQALMVYANGAWRTVNVT